MCLSDFIKYEKGGENMKKKGKVGVSNQHSKKIREK